MPAEQCGDPDRRVVDEMEQKVVRVVTSVYELATTAGRASRSPAECLFVELEREDIGGASGVHLAQPALANHLTRRADRGKVQLIVGAHQRDPGGRYGTSHGGGLFQRQAKRLLAKDVLARRRRRDDRILVQVMRQADVDRINIW